MALTHDYPVSLLCQVLDYPRSSYYHQIQEAADGDLQAALLRLAEEWPTYGYRRLTAHLRREGWVVNSKKVRRLMRTLGLQGKRVIRKRHTTNSEHDLPRYPNLVQGWLVLSPDHVWVACQLPLAHHVCALAPGIRLPGGADGRIHAQHPGLASGA